MIYDRRRKSNSIIILSFITFFFTSNILCIKEKKSHQFGIINGTDVRVRTKASINSKIVTVLKLNTEVEIIGSKQTNDKKYKKWYKIRLNNNVSGFVYSKLITISDKHKVVYTQDKIIRIEYIKNKIAILQNKKNKLLKIINLKRDITDITCSNNSSILFIAAYDFDKGDVFAIFSGIYDSERNKWIIKFKSKSLPNPSVHSFSSSGKYVAVDTGTAPAPRGLTIVNLETGKVAYQTTYIPGGKIWIGNDILRVYQEDYECKKKIPKPKVVISLHHIRKLVQWRNGKERVIKKCISGYQRLSR